MKKFNIRSNSNRIELAINLKEKRNINFYTLDCVVKITVGLILLQKIKENYFFNLFIMKYYKVKW